MSLPRFFISCDWGTSNFRLKLLKTDSLEILAEHKTNQGIKSLHQQYLSQQKLDQLNFFAQYLLQQIQVFPEANRNHLVVLAGMASSNIGLCELPYSDLPFDQEGASLFRKKMRLPNGLDILLISGVKGESGMMRGEEIQAVGLAEQLIPYKKGILILPGTHSKHISYRDGKFWGLKNFMTGELFEVLGKHSILANSLAKSSWNPERNDAFHEGLSLGLEGLLSSSLFSIRAHHLLRNSKQEDNYYFLSGLLIGDELKYLQNEQDHLFLAAPDPIFTLYRLALETISAPGQLVLFKEKMLEQALLLGKKKILTLSTINCEK